MHPQIVAVMANTGVNLVSKYILIVASIVLSILFFSALYFYQTMTVGDTKGLLERLENMDGVVSVGNYTVYEGNAFFTLALSNGGYLELGGVGNADIAKSDGIIVEGIGTNNIVCTKDGSSIRTAGVSAYAIQRQYLNNKTLNSVSKLIDNYVYLDELFSKSPLAFESLITPSETISDDAWTCKTQPKESESID